MSVTLEDDEDRTTLGRTSDGRPDLAEAEALGIVAASATRRSLAFAVDAAAALAVATPMLVGILPVLARMVEGDAPAQVVADPQTARALLLYAVTQGALALLLLVQLLLHGLRGRTLGKSVLGIRSVSVVDLGKPAFWRILVRALVFNVALVIVPLLGAVPFLLSPLWDPQRRGRGWLDRLGGNWLVDVRRGLDPFDAKALRQARRRIGRTAVTDASPLVSLATSAAGAVASFIPAERSSSGVVGIRRSDELVSVEPWSPPVVSAVPPVPTSRPDTAPPRAVLLLDDGSRLTVSGTTLIGRNPQPGHDESGHALVALPDPTSQISKTHLSIDVGDSGTSITDRGSSNGTVVTIPGEGPVTVTPWSATPVPWQSVVEIGGRVFTVTANATPSPEGTA